MNIFKQNKRSRKQMKEERDRVFAELEARAAERRRREERRREHAGKIYRTAESDDKRDLRGDVPGYIQRRPVDWKPAVRKMKEAIPSELRIEGVKVVRRDQYRGCEQLVSVFIGPEVEVIEEGAFANCPNLKKIELSEGLKMIGAGAFAHCPQLENFKLPSTLISLFIPPEEGEEERKIRLPAFMRGAYLDDGYSNQAGAFEGCKRITHVEIPDGVCIIPRSTFENCTHLKSVVFPVHVDIGARAFAKCKRLAALDFSGSVMHIGFEAFEGCEALREVKLYGDTNVDMRAFKDCTGLERLSISEKISFDGSVFVNCPQLSKVEYPAENGLTFSTFINCPVGEDVLLNILRRMLPGLPEDARVDQFIGAEKMTIPEGVTEIRDGAFPHHPTLRELTLPASLRIIGKEAFIGSNRLEDIHFSRGLSRIADGAFKNCSLDFLNFPEGLEEIGREAFSHNPATHVNFPNSLKAIGEGAFRKTDLRALLLNDGIEYIGAEAFANTLIEIAVLPNDLSGIAERCFCGSEKLAWVHLPAALESIGSGAFEGCALSKIQLPAKIKRVHARAFGDCKYLEEAVLPNGVKHVDSTAFEGCWLDCLEYPDSVCMPVVEEKRCFDGMITEYLNKMRYSRCYDEYTDGVDCEGYPYYEDLPKEEYERAKLCGYPKEISVPAHLAHMHTQFPDAVKFIVRETAPQEEA